MLSDIVFRFAPLLTTFLPVGFIIGIYINRMVASGDCVIHEEFYDEEHDQGYKPR